MDRAAPNIGAVLRDSPGVTVRQDNGGHDVIISIRGSNARSARVNRNVVVLEDGFPLTQPDGISRFDLTDPRAYGGITVLRGPQSALFGNYAVGGALAFTTRTGAEIDGAEVGVDTGSFGYVNTYLGAGRASGPFDLALFVSGTGGSGYQDHAGFDVQTVNGVARYTPAPGDRFTLKIIDNRVQADLPARASLNQYRINPYQRGCAVAALAAPGCVLTSLPLNGITGPSAAVTADEGAFGRGDRRSVAALRWEHDVDAWTAWRAQVVFDERNFDQPYYVTAVRGSFPSWNALLDLTHRHDVLGLPALTYLAVNASAIDIHFATFNRAPFGGPRLGALIGDFAGVQSNAGLRARTEVSLDERWTTVLGLSLERTGITGLNRAFAYPAGRPVETPTRASRTYDDTAPELALIYRPDAAWTLRARAAAGYATPTAANLFITAAGLPGDNTGLRAQTSTGLDVGMDWAPLPGMALGVTVYGEAVRNELIAQTPSPGRLGYTFNAPASAHRGVEIGGDWTFSPGWRGVLAYAFNDQVYTRYTETLGVGAASTRFDRAGRTIPGISAHQALVRLGYDHPGGPLAGLGGYVEVVSLSDFFLDNANLLKAPGYALVNANLHFGRALGGGADAGAPRRIDLYVEIRNVLGATYVSSAQTLTNTLDVRGGQNGASVLAATPGAIYAGPPRTFVSGMKLTF